MLAYLDLIDRPSSKSYVSIRAGIKPFKTPPYLFIAFSAFYSLQLIIRISLVPLASEVKWIGAVWSILNLSLAGTFIYVAGTYPLKTIMPCGNVAKPHDVSDPPICTFYVNSLVVGAIQYTFLS